MRRRLNAEEITKIQNDIVEKYGLEHDYTIHIFKLTGNHTYRKEMVMFYYNKYMTAPIDEDWLLSIFFLYIS